MATRLTPATAPTQASSHIGETLPHRSATMISAATTLAAAKKGARWAREISCTSRSGELSNSAVARREAQPTPRREVEPKSIAYNDLGASYIRPPFHVADAAA